MKHNMSEAGIKLIKYYEGFSPKPYKCPAGHMTIGYGHLIRKGENYTEISEEEAEMLLLRDLKYAENAVEEYINFPISDNQFSSLASFVYNLGSASLQRSTLRQKINYGSSAPEEIYCEFMKWVYCSGRKLKGLIRRRHDEACLYLS